MLQLIIIIVTLKKATLWFTNEQPKYNVDFWDIVDEWLVIGFE